MAVCCSSDSIDVVPPQLLEQPGVLDGDDGLGGKILNQIDLLVREKTNDLAVNHKRTDEIAILQHRDNQSGSHPSEIDRSYPTRVSFRISAALDHIGNVDSFLGPHSLTKAVRRPPRSPLPDIVSIRAGHPLPRNCPKLAVCKLVQNSKFGVANVHRIGQHLLKYWLKLSVRARNRLQDLGSNGQDLRGRRLLPPHLHQPPFKADDLVFERRDGGNGTVDGGARLHFPPDVFFRGLPPAQHASSPGSPMHKD